MRTIKRVGPPLCVLFALATQGATAVTVSPRYTVNIFGNRDSASVAYGLNSSGDLVGHTFVYDGRSVQDIYPFEALGISNAGVVAGYMQDGWHAAIWRDGSVQLLPSLPDESGSYAYGVNSRGDVVGHSNTSDSRSRAVIWSKGSVKELPIGGPGAAYAINDAGEITGSVGAGTPRAFLFTHGRTIDLGVLPGCVASYGRGINARGQVVGLSADFTGDCERAFLYDGLVMKDLGHLPGRFRTGARGINNAGFVVGESGDNAEFSGFLYDGVTMYDLNNLVPAGTPHILAGTAINDAGQIAGLVRMDDGWTVAVLLTPCRGACD